MLIASLLASGASADTTYFSEDFDAPGLTDADLSAAGWTFLDTAAAREDATWTLTNPGGRSNPPTTDGTPTSGGFLISDSDAATMHGIQWESGASHDVVTPGFSVASGSAPYLHMDVSAVLNDQGTAIFDVEASSDQGSRWTSVFTRVAPGRYWYGADTRMPDNSNADGYYGHLDVDLTAFAGATDLRLRIRHFEPTDDWFIAFDNIVVDDVAPLSAGPNTAFWEDFGTRTLGQMSVYGLQADGDAISTWTAIDTGYRYEAGEVHERGVNRLMHPVAEGGGEEVEFAILDSDHNGGIGVFENEYLHTPILDLSDFEEVVLEYDSETVVSGDPHQRVLLMHDDGDGVPNAADAVAAILFDYNGGGATARGQESRFAHRTLNVPIAAGRDDVYFAFHYEGEYDWWWAIDNVHVSGTIRENVIGDTNFDNVVNIDDLNNVRNNFGATGADDGTLDGDAFPFDGVVNIDDLNGVRNNFGAGTVAVPEPEGIVLLLLALGAGAARRSARCGQRPRT